MICSPGQNNEYYDLQFKSNISSEIPLSVDITEDHNRHSSLLLLEALTTTNDTLFFAKLLAQVSGTSLSRIFRKMNDRISLSRIFIPPFTTFQVTNFEIRLPRELGESTWPYQGGAIGPFAVVVGSLPHHDGLEHSTKWFF